MVETNCRFGDPETQATLPLLHYPDFVPLLLGTINKVNNLRFCRAEWKNKTSVCVTLAAEGYPLKPKTGDIITGLEEAAAIGDVILFHAGTDVLQDGRYITAGGRVLNIVGFAPSIAEARAKAYAAARCIKYSGMWYREDIGEF